MQDTTTTTQPDWDPNWERDLDSVLPEGIEVVWRRGKPGRYWVVDYRHMTETRDGELEGEEIELAGGEHGLTIPDVEEFLARFKVTE
jgi:hypothetical protein